MLLSLRLPLGYVTNELLRRSNQRTDNFLDDSLDITTIEAGTFEWLLQILWIIIYLGTTFPPAASAGEQQAGLVLICCPSHRLSHRQLSRIAEVCARNRHYVQDKDSFRSVLRGFDNLHQRMMGV